MFKTIQIALTVYRVKKIAEMLKRDYKINIMTPHDMTASDLIIKLVRQGNLSNKQIAVYIYEMVQMQNALFAKVEAA